MTRARELPLWFIAVVCTALTLAPKSSDAQSDAEILADLRSCSSLARDRARLACFDGLLTVEYVAPSAVASASSPDASTKTVTDPPRSTAGVISLDQRAEPSPVEKDGPTTLMIVEVNAALAGAARFLTDTGQLLIQTSGSTPRSGYPDVPFQATLESGTLGSQFLRVSERRRVRVKFAE
jgi:hypothetical protein